MERRGGSVTSREARVEEGGEHEEFRAPNAAADFDPLYGLAPILTVDEAARFLRVNAKTVYAAIGQGLIPAKKISDNRIVIVRDKLLRWLESDNSGLPQKRRR